MSRILLWSVVGVVLLAAVVIALALAPKVAVLVIVAVGIAALAVRLALWMRLQGFSAAERDGAAGDLVRDEQMQTLQRDKASPHRPRPLGIVDRSSRRRRGRSAAAGRRSPSRPRRPQSRVDLLRGFARLRAAQHVADARLLRRPVVIGGQRRQRRNAPRARSVGMKRHIVRHGEGTWLPRNPLSAASPQPP